MYASAPAFTGDSRWLGYSIGVSPAERDKLTKDKKPIRNALGIRTLATGATETVKDVSQFRFSGDGKFIALRRYPAEGKRAADLIVQDLERGTKMTFGNVSEFAWSEGRALLAFTVETDGGAGNAVQLHGRAPGGGARALRLRVHRRAGQAAGARRGGFFSDESAALCAILFRRTKVAQG